MANVWKAVVRLVAQSSTLYFSWADVSNHLSRPDVSNHLSEISTELPLALGQELSFFLRFILRFVLLYKPMKFINICGFPSFFFFYVWGQLKCEILANLCVRVFLNFRRFPFSNKNNASTLDHTRIFQGQPDMNISCRCQACLCMNFCLLLIKQMKQDSRLP